MKTYTYTQARQKLAQLLDEARDGDEVRITGWTAEEIVAKIRELRERP